MFIEKASISGSKRSRLAEATYYKNNDIIEKQIEIYVPKFKLRSLIKIPLIFCAHKNLIQQSHCINTGNVNAKWKGILLSRFF